MSSDLRNDIYERLSIVETKIAYIEEVLDENKRYLTNILNKIDNLFTQVTHQCALFPRLEETVNKTLERTIVQDKMININNFRSKITWGIIVSLITGIVMLFIKLKIGV